jgi:phosphoribosylaminoimidazole carboxylase (NCAIR synthetase)
MGSIRILLLGCATPTVHGQNQLRRAVAQAGSRGITLVGADTAQNLPRLVPGLITETVPLAAHDPEECAEWARTKPDIQAVVTFREMYVESAAVIAAELGLAGNTLDAIRTIRNKDLCRAALRRAGMPQPECAKVADIDEAKRFLAATGPGPWVMKPVDGMGSTGVTLVRAPGDLGRSFASIDTCDRPGQALLETFVAGREYSAEGLMLSGQPVLLGITAKMTGAGFVETGHRMPATLSAASARHAEREVSRALLTVGITHGIFHVEFWDTPRGIVLGELHARPGGDFIHLLTEETRPGCELFGALFDDVLGHRPGPFPPQTRSAGADFIVLPPGTVRSVSGWEDVLADPAVCGAGLFVKSGQQIGAVRSSSDRHGVIAARGKDLSEVNATLARVRDRLRVTVDVL